MTGEHGEPGPSSPIEYAPGAPSCGSYHPGHDVHWIPVLRRHRDTVRIEVLVTPLFDGWFAIDDGNAVERCWNHRPEHVAATLRVPGVQVRRVARTQFVIVEIPGSDHRTWFSLAAHPTPCRVG